MKYVGKKSIYLLYIIGGLFLIGDFTFVLCYRWNDFTWERALLIVIASLCVSAVACLLFPIARPVSFALLQDDGIHIFSSKKEALTVIPWKKVKMCKRVRGEVNNPWYAMLILRFGGTFCGKQAERYRSSPRAKLKEVKQYRLDERMEMLSRGELTEEEFLDIPFLLLLADEREFEQYQALWEAGRSADVPLRSSQ